MLVAAIVVARPDANVLHIRVYIFTVGAWTSSTQLKKTPVSITGPMAYTCLLCGKISKINALRCLLDVLTHCKGQVTMVTNQQRAGFLLPDADFV
jgi:hypothetical protein